MLHLWEELQTSQRDINNREKVCIWGSFQVKNIPFYISVALLDGKKVTYLVQIQIYHWLVWTTEPLDEIQQHREWPKHLVCISKAQTTSWNTCIIFEYSYAIKETSVVSEVSCSKKCKLGLRAQYNKICRSVSKQFYSTFFVSKFVQQPLCHRCVKTWGNAKLFSYTHRCLIGQ